MAAQLTHEIPSHPAVLAPAPVTLTVRYNICGASLKEYRHGIKYISCEDLHPASVRGGVQTDVVKLRLCYVHLYPPHPCRLLLVDLAGPTAPSPHLPAPSPPTLLVHRTTPLQADGCSLV